MAEIITKKGKQYHIFDKINNVWNLLSFWTHSDDIEFPDGKTATTKLQDIDGITDSLNSTSSRIAASAKAVNTLNNNLTWKLAGSATGSNVVTLPEQFNELMIEVKAPTSTNYSYTFSILKQMLSNTEKRFLNGFYYKNGGNGTPVYGVCKLSVSLTTVKLPEVFEDYINKTSGCTIYVYYK